MEFIGTKFSITLGTWRLNFAFNVEETADETLVAAPQRAHHVIYTRDYSKAR